MRIKELKDLQKNILSIPAESLLYHASRNHISRWLYSRALFPLAEFIRRRWPHNLDELPEIRQEIFDSIVLYRKMKNRGVVAILNETVSTNTPISPVSGKVRWEEKGAAWHLSTHSSNATPYSKITKV